MQPTTTAPAGEHKEAPQLIASCGALFWFVLRGVDKVAYTVENWSGMTMLISRKGTAYNCEEGIGQPHSFPGGTPLRKQGNRVLVMNVGGFIEEVKK